jgi:hypothetical protein
VPTNAPRRFRFSLRALFVLVAVAAIPCAWVSYSRHWIRERRAILGHPETIATFRREPASFHAPYSLWLWGEAGIYEITYPPGFIHDERTRRRSRWLFPEAEWVPPDDFSNCGRCSCW